MNLQFNKKHLGTTCFLLFFCTGAFAQALDVSGHVKNLATNEPIEGALVWVKGSKKNTSTNKDGNFFIKAPPQAILVISSMNHFSKEVPILNRDTLSIEMKESPHEFPEIIVVGYGVEKNSLISGAISSLNFQEFKRPGMLRPDDVLQGKVAGVMVMANSGQPGEDLSIRIRGIGTNGNPSPLFIVDGQPMDDIVFLNPRDIESMEILKDAASSAIYGARGANGVLLITTKRGKLNERMSINYDFSYGIQRIRKKMDLLDANQYMILQNETALNDGQQAIFSQEDMAHYTEAIGRGTDWQQAIIYKNAPIVNHQVRLAGGSDKTAYTISASYFNQDGIFAKDKSNYNRITLREGTDHVYFDKALKIGQSVVMTHVVQKGIDSNNLWGGPILGALNMDPLTPVFNPDGSFAESQFVSQEIVNPVAQISIINNRYRTSHIIANAYADLTFLKYFNVHSSISSELYFDDNVSYSPVYRLNPSQINLTSSVEKVTSYSKNMLYENVLTFNRELGGHRVKLMIGNTVLQSNGDNLGGSKKDLLIDDPAYAYLDLAKNEESARARGGAWHSALASYFGRANYSYKDRYMLTTTFRADGSTRFGKNNRFGYFPSMSVGWNIAKEDFMETIKGIKLLKLRASWGQNGNDRIGDWQYLSTVSTRFRGYTFNNIIFSGASPTKVANPDLKWETSEQINWGIDAKFLDRFAITADYYIKKTKDLLMIAPIPSHVGAPPAAANVGSVRNTGVELSINYMDWVGDFKWDVDFNISHNKNKVTKVGNNENWIGGAFVGTAMSNVTRMEEGQPISFFWGYLTDGIFQNAEEVLDYRNKDGQLILPDAQAGDIRFVDRNQDGKIDDNDRTNIGNPNPDFTAGLSLSLSWKCFDISALFAGMFGNEVFNATRRWDLPMSNYPSVILERWHAEGTSSSLPRVTASDPNENYARPSKFFLEDGSFVRLRNVTFGYTTSDLQKYYINKLRLYVSASNLFTLAGYSGLDPEIGSSDVLRSGIDYGIYPLPRTFMFGVSITF